MAEIKFTDGTTIITSERDSDVQIAYVERSTVRAYFDQENARFPLGEGFTLGLDEAQNTCDPEHESVVILVIQDNEA